MLRHQAPPIPMLPTSATKEVKRIPNTKPPHITNTISTMPPKDGSSVAEKLLAKHPLQETFASRYRIISEVGSGGFGFVVSAVRVEDNLEVAVKFILKSRVPVQNWAIDREVGLLPMEIHLLRRLKHPNIVRFLDVYEDDKFFYLVMEMHGSPWTNPHGTSFRHPSQLSFSQHHQQQPQQQNQYPEAQGRVPSRQSSINRPLMCNTRTASSSNLAVYTPAQSVKSILQKSQAPPQPQAINNGRPTTHVHFQQPAMQPLPPLPKQPPGLPVPPPFAPPAEPTEVPKAPINGSTSNGACASSGTAASQQLPGGPLQRRMTFPLPPKLTRRASMDLFECIEQHDCFGEEPARIIFMQVADAVGYLHSHSIVHRDIKDENILIDDLYRVKIIDFGSAAIEPNHNPNHLFDKFQGTIQYASPEILKGEKYRGRPLDIWDLGVLLYTMLYGEVPFSSSEEAIHCPYRLPRVKSSPECIDLLNWLLEKHPLQRPTAQQVLNHPWLTRRLEASQMTGKFH
ncbi:hypothetical protein HK102_004710 [Quaeritorhiza haematococci]|nr:hypothetical protein HK102_004710 [Quaeritorhiza haematococci]